MGAAVDSLNETDKRTFDLAVKRVAEYKFIRNKLQSLSESSLVYQKLKRLFLAADMNNLPSTQDLLTRFSEQVYLSSCNYSYSVDDSSLQNFIKSFWKETIFLGDFLDPKNGSKSSISALKLSKLIL